MSFSTAANAVPLFSDHLKDTLGELTVAAFDVRLNADILAASATLARTYGVEESKILRTTFDVDQFMLS